MASYTDNNVPQFNEYVAQLPVEAMVKVGMGKQQKYDLGVQKIDAAVETIAGLDVIRDVDKAYLQSKVNELGNNMQAFMASDFSDSQLTNTVSGMATRVGKDRAVKTAVASTAKYRNEVKIMEEARAKGELTPENETYFSKQAQPWLNGSDVNEGFSGKYIPYFDVEKHTREVFNAMKPGSYSFDQIFETDSRGNRIFVNGQPVLSKTMKRLKKEGLFPERIQDAINQVMSEPRVSQQLDITGQYVYRGKGTEELLTQASKLRDADMASYEDNKAKLLIEAASGTDVTEQLEMLESQKTKIEAGYEDYFKTIETNSDAVRGQIYTNDTKARYANMFGYLNVTEEVLANPEWEANFKINQEATKRSQWVAERQWDMQKYGMDRQYKYDALAVAQQNADANSFKAGLNPNGTAVNNPIEGFEGPNSEEENKTRLALVADNRYTSAADNYNKTTNDLIWKVMYAPDEKNETKLQQIQDKYGISLDEAKSRLLTQAAGGKEKEEAYRTNMLNHIEKKIGKNSTPELISAKNNYVKSNTTFKQESTLKQKRDEAEAKAVTDAGLDEVFKNITPQSVNYGGKTYNLSKQNVIDMATYAAGKSDLWGAGNTDGENFSAKQAYARLDAAGLGDIAGRIRQQQTNVLPETIVMEGLSTARDMFMALPWNGGQDHTTISEFTGNVGMNGLVKSIQNSNYDKVTSAVSNVTKNQYVIPQNRVIPVDTKGTPAGLREVQGTFSSISAAFNTPGGAMNIAPKEQFEGFQNTLEEKDVKYSYFNTVDFSGKPVWAVQAIQNGKSVGWMGLNPDQLSMPNININSSSMFQSKPADWAQELMTQNSGKTSKLPLDKQESYSLGTVTAFSTDNGDFPSVSAHTVRANISQTGSEFFGYLYIDNGDGAPGVYKTKGKPSLEGVVQTMLQLSDAELNNLKNK